jgi:hypothetical protein
LQAHAGFEVGRIHEIEREVKHDVIAFTTAVSETLARAGQMRSLRSKGIGPLRANEMEDGNIPQEQTQCKDRITRSTRKPRKYTMKAPMPIASPSSGESRIT